MLRVVIVLGWILAVGGTAGAASMPNTAILPIRHTVEVRGLSFVPQSTVVSAGDTIVWINRDIVPHAITAEGGQWPPHTLLEGQSWEMVVEQGGTYPYFCLFHPQMRGLLATQ
jgi:plastocyanin